MIKKEIKRFGNSLHIILPKHMFEKDEIAYILTEEDYNSEYMKFSDTQAEQVRAIVREEIRKGA